METLKIKTRKCLGQMLALFVCHSASACRTLLALFSNGDSKPYAFAIRTNSIFINDQTQIIFDYAATEEGGGGEHWRYFKYILIYMNIIYLITIIMIEPRQYQRELLIDAKNTLKSRISSYSQTISGKHIHLIFEKTIEAK